MVARAARAEVSCHEAGDSRRTGRQSESDPCSAIRCAGNGLGDTIAPTTDERRLPIVLSNATGFVYFVSITGVTGSAAPDAGLVREAVARLKRHTKLPVVVGFGVKNADSAAAIAEAADGVVVGSALVDAVRVSLTGGTASPSTVGAVTGLVETLARGLRAVPK